MTSWFVSLCFTLPRALPCPELYPVLQWYSALQGVNLDDAFPHRGSWESKSICFVWPEHERRRRICKAVVT